MNGGIESRFKYWAFISYCHRDKKWGKWLHEALETYRVPKELVGQPTQRGHKVPARLFPIYRDREESPTSADLGQVIQNSLEQSRYLIVICSPHSARSRWVNEEVRSFKRLGGENRILCIIVDGEPNASDGKPSIPREVECFPEALRFKLGPNGEMTTERTEPVCGDVRAQGDGKNNAFLKLLAGLLGVNFDALRQRERARQWRRRLWMAAAAGLMVASVVCFQIRFTAVSHAKALQTAQAALAKARKALADGQPALAVEQALSALDSAAGAGRPLEPARWVLRRALDANRVAGRWQAHHGGVKKCAFDSSGARLMTFSSDDDEVRIWSVPEGRLLSSIKLALHSGWLAGWDAGTNEIVTASETVQADLNIEVELASWNPDTGALLRKTILDHCARAEFGGFPEWIAVHDYSANLYRLVRLRDGVTKSTLPELARGGHSPICVKACGVVVMADPSGARLFAVDGGRELGRLEGLKPGKDLNLEGLVASADGTRFAAFVREGRDLRGVGVWRAADGGNVVSYADSELELSSETYAESAPGDRLISNSKKLLAALAAPLGRQPIEVPVWDAAGAAWEDIGTESSPVAAVVGRMGRVSLLHLGLGLESELDTSGAQVNSITFSPSGHLLATGDEWGGLILWSTSVPVKAESELPETVSLVKPRITGGDPNAGQVLLHSPMGGDQLVIWDLAAHRSTATIGGVVAPPDTSLKFAWNQVDALLVAQPEMPLAGPTPANWQTAFYETKSGRMLGRRPATPTILAPHGRRALAWDRGYWEVMQAGDNGLVATPLVPAHPAVSNWVNQAGFTPDGEHVVTAAGNGWIEVHSARTGLSERSFRFAEDLDTSVNDLCISPSGRWMLLGTYNRWWRVSLTDNRATEVFTTGEGPQGPGWAFLNNEQTLVGDGGADIRWWTFPDLVPIASVPGAFDSELTIPLTESGELLLLGRYSWPRNLVIADFRSGAVRSRFANVLTVDPKGKLAVVGTERGAQVVRLRDAEVLADFPPADSACVAADGSMVGLVLRDSGRFVSIPVSVDETELRARASQLRRWPSASSPQPKK